MKQHDRWPIRIARPEIDDIEMRAGNLDGVALLRLDALQGHHTGLRDQRQNRQRQQAEEYDHGNNPEDGRHQPVTASRSNGFESDS